MKSLIVFYSHSGNNEKLAYRLKELVGCDIYKISEVKKRKTISILIDLLFKRTPKLATPTICVKDYDSIIFVAPIWGGKIASPMKAFIEQEKNNFAKYFYITLCNSGIGQKEKIVEQLNSIVQRKPGEVIELSINNLLPEEKKFKIKHTFNFKISKQDLEMFDQEIDSLNSMVNS
jgi:flavodoxin